MIDTGWIFLAGIILMFIIIVNTVTVIIDIVKYFKSKRGKNETNNHHWL